MVHLDPMSESQFQAYLSTAVENYAQEHVKAGDCAPEDALMVAQKDYRELLPDGLQSKNIFLFSIRDDALDQNPIVGMIWFAAKEGRTAKSAFIYDLRIREDLRGKGYGRKAMQKFENLVQAMGIGRIGLNVFGHRREGVVREDGLSDRRHRHEQDRGQVIAI